MAKAAHAFRTISEVSTALDTPAHVLRFWESRFPQVKPVKRAGGRRYYRPEDLALLGGIKALLHEDGHSIKDVQKLLREKGARHVAMFSTILADEDDEELDGYASTTAARPAPTPSEQHHSDGETATLIRQRTAQIAVSAETDERPGPAQPDDDQPAGILTLLARGDRAKLRASAPSLGPILDRIEALRDRLVAARHDAG